ncbi:hypothetical protein [Dyella jejuensis]
MTTGAVICIEGESESGWQRMTLVVQFQPAGISNKPTFHHLARLASKGPGARTLGLDFAQAIKAVTQLELQFILIFFSDKKFNGELPFLGAVLHS